MSSQEHKLLDAMEEFAKLAAAATGMRKQLIDEGWSQESAEAIVVHVFVGVSNS